MKREESGLFMHHYVPWRETRIAKIEQIFGKEFFKNKTILELACGFGDIGKYFSEKLGAKVTFTDGRIEHLPIIKQNNPGCEAFLLNQENEWNFGKKFDIIIHSGVLYHLWNWKQDLQCALGHTDLLILETEVADSNDSTFEYEFNDPEGYEQSMSENGKAKRASAPLIESIFHENRFNFVRYDDPDLNADMHHYDWKVTGAAEKVNYTRNDGIGKRRFWVARRK